MSKRSATNNNLNSITKFFKASNDAKEGVESNKEKDKDKLIISNETNTDTSFTRINDPAIAIGDR
jgi:hypothetical protein